jgi:hypothetical protein
MNKLIAVVVLGLSSSVALAQPTTESDHGDGISYECKFESKCDGKKVECRVEGLLCNETHDFEDGKRCENFKDPIKIECHNGFELESRDAAVVIDNGTLWVNADDRSEIATLRVKDFKDDEGHDEFYRKADLLFSKKVNEADRLEGACKFKKNGRHSPPPMLQ